MTPFESERDRLVAVLKALGDPIRLEIMVRMVNVDELPCTLLERKLPITKSTISHHMRTLRDSGLVSIRKDGRYYCYTARRDQLEEVLPGLVERLERLACDAEPEPVA